MCRTRRKQTDEGRRRHVDDNRRRQVEEAQRRRTEQEQQRRAEEVQRRMLQAQERRAERRKQEVSLARLHGCTVLARLAKRDYLQLACGGYQLTVVCSSIECPEAGVGSHLDCRRPRHDIR